MNASVVVIAALVTVACLGVTHQLTHSRAAWWACVVLNTSLWVWIYLAWPIGAQS